jgi:hypothetical protein
VSTHPAHARDIVRVHPGIHAHGHHLGGMHLTVTAVHDDTLLDLAEWTGSPLVTLPASDVDVITPLGATR